MKKIKQFIKNIELPPYKSVYIGSIIVGLILFYKLLTLSSWIITFLILILVIVILVIWTKNNSFLKQSVGNGIIYGSRGAGKGILLQKKANSFKKIFSNVPMGVNTKIINPKEYIQSIGDNTILDTINGSVKVVKKLEKFEGINVLLDDINLYFPNFEDKLLKEEYPSMPLTLAVNRHLYDSYMIITTQDLERPYKILRELQTDFYIKAIKTFGFGKLWSSLPFFRNFVSVKYIYYDNNKAAVESVLPWKGVSATTEATKSVYMTAGQATKEQFKAQYGNVFYGRIWMSKKRLFYDTRYFHKVFFGKKAPNQ